MVYRLASEQRVQTGERSNNFPLGAIVNISSICTDHLTQQWVNQSPQPSPTTLTTCLLQTETPVRQGSRSLGPIAELEEAQADCLAWSSPGRGETIALQANQ